MLTEAEGSSFDAVVFLHVTDANWPAPERVHPLLPWALQRALKMPGSDPGLAVSSLPRAYGRLVAFFLHDVVQLRDRG